MLILQWGGPLFGRGASNWCGWAGQRFMGRAGSKYSRSMCSHRETRSASLRLAAADCLGAVEWAAWGGGYL